ncbi:bifunctional biotin--[acetyl-CoA-carboxylase] synthetase/biotin operon repressor [Thermococcus pacificus]|uniref:Bifunctional biotin--[acetyl-CoA-carboxylase] synthetase/biotin operon repressor n=1 Tax=Thermococcus pacificus TaxID=71998 RepID=A0A218P9J0_9EURY|nr:bifunctional biotin--[acetyl-CoA-carboxylase] synthetase/biotin operon repressor [Thermococcus pacificus]
MVRDSRIKRAILRELREKECVSGEFLAESLGVSRVAVWKNIRELISLGYEIRASRKGYSLVSSPEKPYPWELDVRAYYLLETTSTMDIAWKLAEAEEPAGTFVIAERQTRGRGRRGRRWRSEKGGLYFSVILKPALPLSRADVLLDETLDSILDSLRRYGVDGYIEDNGVYVDGKKIAGVLVEVMGELGEVRLAVVGAGINVSNEVPEGATSLSLELGRAPSLLEVGKTLFPTVKGRLLSVSLE